MKTEEIEKHLEDQTKLAFPYARKIGEIEIVTGGLTKREYIAIRAMQALIQVETDTEEKKCMSMLCKVSVMIADAMIEELRK